MFGYVRPYRDELRLRDYDRYRAAYCGLCRALGKQYGFRARFLVNYDMTFLYLVRASAGGQAAAKRCFCPARVFRRKPCICDDGGYGPVAACTVILCWGKIQDNIRDSGFFKGLGYRLLKLLFRRPYRKAARALPAFDRLVTERLAALQRLEDAQSPSIDATADAFAAIVSACADDVAEEESRRPMQSLLYQVGRYIYLCDALDDLKEDVRENAYNPLRCRFTPGPDGLSAPDLDYLAQLMDSSVNLAGSALALLPAGSGTRLLENIVYLGLPAVFTAVRAGRFQKRAKEFPRKETGE